jgi:hypothetical protein
VGHIAVPPPPFPLTASYLEAEFRDAERYRAEHGGLLPDNEFWRYLETRWAVDPSRFDHWHPRIGPWLTENNRHATTSLAAANRHTTDLAAANRHTTGLAAANRHTTDLAAANRHTTDLAAAERDASAGESSAD